MVRAMVGGRDFAKEKYNTVTQARRQPGSSVKPFVWAVAIANGYTPSTVIVDGPFERLDGAGNVWRPKNFDATFHGPMTLRHALEKSVNIVSVKLVDIFGMYQVRAYMQACGITTPIDDVVGLTIGLGTPEVKLIDHCVAYSCFPNGGRRYDPIMVKEIRDRDGIVRYNFKEDANSEQALDPKLAFVMTHLLEGVCTPGPGYYPTGNRTRDLTHPHGGKTGTTNESRNTWFCGFTRQYTCIVWVGYRDNRSLGRGADYTGGRLAAPIWTKFMMEAHEGLPELEFEVPPGVVFHNVDRLTGVAGGSWKEAFLEGTYPPTSWYAAESEGEVALEDDLLEPVQEEDLLVEF
jgi:penicillin-binding protein 1A